MVISKSNFVTLSKVELLIVRDLIESLRESMGVFDPGVVSNVIYEHTGVKPKDKEFKKIVHKLSQLGVLGFVDCMTPNLL
ncbi:MAG: hypothetical protein Q8Q89_00245 [bacterium]|nr:hypothetical protein [bacterium]